MFQMTVYTSTEIEGVKLTWSDLRAGKKPSAALLHPVNLSSPPDHCGKQLRHRFVIPVQTSTYRCEVRSPFSPL